MQDIYVTAVTEGIKEAIIVAGPLFLIGFLLKIIIAKVKKLLKG